MEEIGTVVQTENGKEERVVEYPRFRDYFTRSDLVKNLLFIDEKMREMDDQTSETSTTEKKKKFSLFMSKVYFQSLISQADFSDLQFLKPQQFKKWTLKKMLAFRGLEILYASFWIFLNIALFLTGYLYYDYSQKMSEKREILGIGLPIAKAFSFTIYCNAPLLLILMSRRFLTK
jgi:hypothetical protein